jgi:Family of unknown function (DUF6308)
MTTPIDDGTITLAGIEAYSVEDAFRALVGYAFATYEAKTKPGWGDSQVMQLPVWAYRTYDCVPASDGNDFSDLDVLVLSGLNVRLTAGAIAQLRWAASRAAKPLGHARRLAARSNCSFWDLPEYEIADDPPEGGIGAYLHEAWKACKATPDVGVTRTHKLLHHKAPHLVPVIDRVTRPALSSAAGDDMNLWQVIHRDVRRPAFADLEDRFGAYADSKGEVALTRLRIHDILLWLHRQPSQRASALRCGDRLLG